MAYSERFPPATPDCGGNRLDAAGHCLRASFSCPDRQCPEINGLLMRLFATPTPAAMPKPVMDQRQLLGG